MTIPEFAPGDRAMIVCPCGGPPWPEGPVRVLHCLESTPFESVYVIEHTSGRRESIDGVELWSYDAWLEWMQRHAN